MVMNGCRTKVLLMTALVPMLCGRARATGNESLSARAGVDFSAMRPTAVDDAVDAAGAIAGNHIAFASFEPSNKTPAGVPVPSRSAPPDIGVSDTKRCVESLPDGAVKAGFIYGAVAGALSAGIVGGIASIPFVTPVGAIPVGLAAAVGGGAAGATVGAGVVRGGAWLVCATYHFTFPNR